MAKNRNGLGANMDVFSHWLWGMALTRGKVSWKVSGPMGVLPDLVAFVPASILGIIQGFKRVEINNETKTSDMHPIAWDIYQWSHSLTIALLIFLTAWFILHRRGHESPKKLAWFFTVPWFAHILLDIPGHTLRFFPTPFLHPFSDLMFDGVRWSVWWFFWPQVLSLGIYWWYILKKEKNQSIEDTAETAALA